MSFYATLSGAIQYPDQASFDKVVNDLIEGKWMDAEGYWLDECDQRIDCPVPGICRNTFGIDIPQWHFRNLSRYNFFPQLETGVVKGVVCGTSTDGCFSGWVIVDGVETSYDLTKWAAENIEEPAPVQSDYDESEGDEDDEDEDDYFQDLCDWQTEVETQFHEEFGP